MKINRLIAFPLSLLLAFNPQALIFAQDKPVLALPEPGTMVSVSSSYVPVIVKGLRVHPENPILFDFIMDTGDSGLGVDSAQLRSESEKLIKYFLASLTIPEDDLWVNLSPYEKNRIIPEQLGQTVMGRDMLAQDYILKQLTASLIYPENKLGKEFWNKVYTKAQNLFGTSEIPVNTFNKVWIVADRAKVYVHDNTAFVVACHMKVMLEEDYLAMYKHQQTGTAKPANFIGSQVIREIVIPELEREVNQGKNFADLRQIYNSMILAAWYKKNLKEALLNEVYSNKAKINGIDLRDKTIKEQIYQEYLRAYKKGVFNYIKEDVQADGQSIPRKYFSGGEVFKGIFRGDLAETNSLADPDAAMTFRGGPRGKYVSERVLTPSNTGSGNLPRLDFAMNSKHSWQDPDKVGGLIKDKIESSFSEPIPLNPATSDINYLQLHPGINTWDEIARLADEAARGQIDKARILEALINKSNVMPWIEKDKFKLLKSAKRRSMTDFITAETSKEAMDGLKKGELFIELLAGGAADRAKTSLQRLGLKLPDSYYRIWNIKFWDIIRAAQEGNLIAEGDESKKLLQSIQDVSIPDYEKDYTIGQRLLYAISKGIDDIPDVTVEEKIEIRKNLKIVIHVNDDILKNVIQDLKKFNFFGFTPGNILLVNGGYGPAFKITDHGLEVEKSVKVTWNHLFAVMENKWKKDEVYTFNDKLELVETKGTVNEFLYEHQARYGLVRRVNDAILLHPEGAMDWQFFSAFLGAKQKSGANVLYQVMPNTAKNKGGLAVTLPGMGEFSFPYEGLDSQDFNILQKLTGMDKTPYNRLYWIYDLKSVDDATNKKDIPLSLKIKSTPVNGKNVLLISPETPIGNELLVPGVNGLAVERPEDLLFSKGILIPRDYEGQYTPGHKGHISGERIHDIKTADDFVRTLAPIYNSMDSDLNLEEFTARFKNHVSKTSDKAMNGGIDLNSKNMQMDINGETIDFKFDPAMLGQFQQGDFSGVVPIILQITPVRNLEEESLLKTA